MSDINLQLVREFLELNLFHVLTFWQHGSARPTHSEHSMLLFVENVKPGPERKVEFVLNASSITSFQNAVVDIRAWHGDRVYPSVVESNPVLATLAREDTRSLARDILSTEDFKTILVISELPKNPEQRAKSVKCLQETGIDHIMEFSTVIEGVLDKICENTNYTMSQTLQLLRLLKKYSFIRNQQMEFTFPTEPPTSNIAPDIETSIEPDEVDED